MVASNDMKRETEIFTLPSGMRLLCIQADSAVEYFGVAVNSGSRDEIGPSQFGLAHFVEHTLFKGTHRKKASAIINRMETVGGDLNAFTTKEETNIYSVFPKGNLKRAAELIFDLVTDSVFPTAEIDKEREVVRDEIDSYLDSPSEAVYDDFEDLFFAHSQLGHNILGTDSALDGFTSDVCRNYLTGNFIATRMVAYYLGPRAPKDVCAVIGQYACIPAEGCRLDRVPPVAVPRFDIRREIDTHQSHTVVGAALPGITSSLNDAIALVTNVLGGPGMNSRLNVALRERRGLVYTVEASTTIFSDSGLFNVYFGCDPSDRDRCLELVFKELQRLANSPLTASRLMAAKRQFIGQLIVGSENSEQQVLNAARGMLLLDRTRNMAQMVSAIESLTSEDIAQAASLLIPEKCSVLSLG